MEMEHWRNHRLRSRYVFIGDYLTCATNYWCLISLNLIMGQHLLCLFIYCHSSCFLLSQLSRYHGPCITRCINKGKKKKVTKRQHKLWSDTKHSFIIIDALKSKIFTTQDQSRITLVGLRRMFIESWQTCFWITIDSWEPAKLNGKFYSSTTIYAFWSEKVVELTNNNSKNKYLK